MRAALRKRTVIVVTLAVILTALLAVLSATVRTSRVVGPSMTPTLRDGQHLLVLRYLFYGPHRGDVIVYRLSGNEPSDFVKRVIGIPGDTIDIHGGSVYVNGEEFEEDVRTKARRPLDYPVTVPPGKYFVLGDNRGASNDSRALGFVDADDIVGYVLGRYWPLSALKIF